METPKYAGSTKEADIQEIMEVFIAQLSEHITTDTHLAVEWAVYDAYTRGMGQANSSISPDSRRIEELEAENRRQKSVIHTLKGVNESIRKENTELSIEIDRLNGELEIVWEMLDRVKGKLDNPKESAPLTPTGEEEFRRTKAQLDSTQALAEQRLVYCVDLRKEIDRLRGVEITNKRDISTALEENARLRDQLEALREENRRLEEKQAADSHEHMTQRDSWKALQEQLQTRLDALDKENDLTTAEGRFRIERQYEREIATIRELQSERDVYKYRSERLATEVLNLVAEKERSENQANNWEYMADQMEHRVGELESVIERLEEEMAEAGNLSIYNYILDTEAQRFRKLS